MILRLNRAAFLCLVSISSQIPQFVTAANAKPNILVIVGDDMGYADVGVQGCKDIPTPHLDSIAASGVRCTNGYVSGPYCSPTRAGLLTGRYQTRFGHELNPLLPKAGGTNSGTENRTGDQEKVEAPVTKYQDGLPLSETTIANRFKAAGYITGLVGKWHLGNAPTHHPQERGFDEFFGFLEGARGYLPGAKPLILRGKKSIEEKEYLTDAFGREATSFIDRHANEPFFLYLAYNAVHTPMEATDAQLDKFKSIEDKQRRAYAGMMSEMDDSIGKVLDELKAKKLERNTLVFFISDNGGPAMPGTTFNSSQNGPLRGSKRTTLEGGIRVPFFVKWPGHVPEGKVYDEPVIQLDILPTALTAAGVNVAADAKLDGVDLLPYLNGNAKSTPHDALYWRLGPQMAVRRGDWKLVRYDPAADRAKGLATNAKLYNLKDDIGERKDLIHAQPQKARELQAAWDKWNELNVAPLWDDPAVTKKNAAGQPAKAVGAPAKAATAAGE
jgi:arylsulfatase A-like enzyme